MYSLSRLVSGATKKDPNTGLDQTIQAGECVAGLSVYNLPERLKMISLQIWKILLVEQEKIARSQLAAVQVIFIS